MNQYCCNLDLAKIFLTGTRTPKKISWFFANLNLICSPKKKKNVWNISQVFWPVASVQSRVLWQPNGDCRGHRLVLLFSLPLIGLIYTRLYHTVPT